MIQLSSKFRIIPKYGYISAGTLWVYSHFGIRIVLKARKIKNYY